MFSRDFWVEALLNIRCITVKDYHLWRFEVNVREVFTVNKKRGEGGNAFKVVNHRGQLGHLQSELLNPLPTTCRYFSVSEFSFFFLWKHDATTFRFLKSIGFPMEQPFNLSKRKTRFLVDKRREYCSPVDIKVKCVYNYCVQLQLGFLCVISVSVNLQPVITNWCQFIYRLVLIIDTNR